MARVAKSIQEALDSIKHDASEGFPRGVAFWDYVALTEVWLEQYPADIFDGSSGDKGQLFVCAIREAVTQLKEDQ